MDDWLTTRQILAELKARGCELTEPQLERWRGRYLLPEAKRVGRGRAAGVERLFPGDTVDRAIAIHELLRRQLSLSDIAIRIWISGFDYEERYIRGWLLDELEKVRRLYSNMAAEGGRVVAEKTIQKLERTPKLRSRYGVSSGKAHELDQLFESVEHLGKSIGDPTVPLADDAVQLMMTVFAVAPAHLEQLAADGVQLRDEIRKALASIDEVTQAVQRTSFAQLQAVRRFCRVVSERVEKLQEPTPESLPWPLPMIASLGRIVSYGEPYGFLNALVALQRATCDSGEAEVIERIEAISAILARDRI